MSKIPLMCRIFGHKIFKTTSGTVYGPFDCCLRCGSSVS